MAKTRKPYPSEYRRKILELHRAGRSVVDIGRQFEVSEQTVRNWVKQDERDQGKRDEGLTSPEREELARLRREVRRLKLEQEILVKAAAWFARESESIPNKDSNS